MDSINENLGNDVISSSRSETYLKILHQTALSMINRHDFDDILTMILKESAQFFSAPNGFILLLEPDEIKIKLRIGLGLFTKYIDRTFLSSDIHDEQNFDSFQAHIINNMKKDPKGNLELFRNEKINSLILLPIKTDERVTGIFGLAYEEEGKLFNESDITLLNGFVELCIIALANAKLFSFVQEEFSELIRVEKELRESEDRYRTLFNLSNDAIILHNHTHIAECNEQTEKMLRLTKTDIIGKTILNFSPVVLSDRSFSREKWESLLEKTFDGQNQILKWKFIRPDGSSFDAIINTSRITLQQEKFVLLIIKEIVFNEPDQPITDDISSLLGDVFNWVQVGIAKLDENENIIFYNKAFDELLEGDNTNLIGINFFDLVDYETKSVIVKETDHRRKGEISTYEIPINTLKGNKKHIWISAAPHFNKDGKYDGGIIIIIDITEKKNTEHALYLSEEKFSMAFHNISDSILIISDDGKIIEVNESTEKVLELNRENIIGKNSFELGLISKDFYNIIADKIARYGSVYNLDYKFTNKNGKEYLFLVSANIIKIKEKSFIFIVARDLTIERKLQDELLKAQKLESIGILAGGIAHNYNNILTGILGNISLAKIYCNPKDKIYERLAEAEKNSLKAKELTKQLITFAKSGEPQKQRKSISKLLEKIIEQFSKNKDISLKVIYNDDLWETELDEAQIEQAFLNIIDNAIDFQKINNISPEVEIVCSNKVIGQDVISLKEGNYALISFKDKGPGIPKANLKKIFDPFYSTEPGKRGIGLPVAYSIIKRHKGFIEVIPNEPNGSIFNVYIPANINNGKKQK